MLYGHFFSILTSSWHGHEEWWSLSSLVERGSLCWGFGSDSQFILGDKTGLDKETTQDRWLWRRDGWVLQNII
jgi:hypothetical protein